MLQSLKIQNIALIPQLEIEFGERMNVLSGETGAGKSIIVGSFNFILGEKLSKTIIRQGESVARVDAVFGASGAVLTKITELSGIDFGENIAVLTRTLKTDGKGEARVNGHIVTTQMLKDIAALLINIHGQHETEVLLKSKNHINILDSFSRNSVIKTFFLEEYEKLTELKHMLKTFGGSDAERKRQIDIYEYQIKEIENAGLRENEDTELAELKQRMTSFEKISNQLGGALKLFSDNEGGIGALYKKALSSLGNISHLDGKLGKLYESAKSTQYDLNEIAVQIRDYADSLEYDEAEFKRVDARLDEIKILKRKYGATIAEIFSFLNEKRAQLEFLTHSEEETEKTKVQISEQQKTVLAASQKLSFARKESAVILESEIIAQLKDLGMPAAQFKVDFTELQDASSNGIDEVEFLFSANAGEPLRPLANIISGGEMSRFMLALKTVTASLDGVRTLVFDEIDTGISGTMGLTLASKMATLSRFHQIIAVTHLPQIAAMADTHFLISKTEINGKTLTSVRPLGHDGQITEIARMTGGGDTTLGQSAETHARALKDWANKTKAQ